MPPLASNRLKIPKYVQLAEYLRNEIDSGRFLPDDRLPSLNDLKQQFGANQHTVERAHTLLENDGLIRREPGRGVFVNHPEPRKMTGSVGFFAPYNMRPEENVAYWGTVMAGMRSAVRDRGYHLLLIDNGSRFESWDKIDGAVLCDMHDPRDPHPGLQPPPADFPGVAILNHVDGFASVTTDDFDGAYQLTQHLIQFGHRRIAYLAAINVNLSMHQRRKQGYLNALEKAGIAPEPRWMREICWRSDWEDLPSWYPAAGEYYMHQWLEQDWNELGCTALVAQSDDVAQGVIRALHAAGLEVPFDVSVVGFDGLLARSGEPELTTIHVPLFDVGERAGHLLLDHLQDPSVGCGKCKFR